MECVESRTNEFIEINYGISQYKRDVPGVSPDPTIVRIPFKGELSVISHHNDPLGPAKKGSGWELPIIFVEYLTENCVGVDECRLEVIWVQERGEWVAIQESSDYEPADGGTDWSCGGPYSLDKICINKILEAYNIPPEKVSNKNIARMSPSELEKLAA